MNEFSKVRNHLFFGSEDSWRHMYNKQVGISSARLDGYQSIDFKDSPFYILSCHALTQNAIAVGGA